MGYESKVFIMERHTGSFRGKMLPISATEIARYDLCVMGYGWNPEKIFKTPIDFEFYPKDGNTPTMVDEYGDHCGMCHLEDLIPVLKEIHDKDDYRRIFPLLGLLCALEVEKDKWTEIVIVHYGH